MDKEVPTWMNRDFLTLALQGGEDGQPRVDITNYTLKEAVAPGNNYTSDVFRVNIDYRNEGSRDYQSISLIVKAPIETGIIKKFSDKIDMLSIEPLIYKTILPVYSEKFNFEFGPKYFYTAVKNSLVLKDLKPDGYVMCDKFKQLDIKHCRKVVNSLAKFHAASVAYYHENPDLMENFHEQFYKEESKAAKDMKSLINSALKFFIEALVKVGPQSMEQYVSERVDQLWSNLVKLLAPSTNTLNVLNHGDCWTNNILFRYNDAGDVTDVNFIDFQIVRYSSPAPDLLYFIWSSGDEDVRDNHQEELYNLYLQALNSTLSDLNCQEKLTHEEFTENLKSYSDWILTIISFELPFLVNDTGNVVDLGKINDMAEISDTTDDKYCGMYKSKRYLELLPGYLRQFERFLGRKNIS